MAGTTGRITLWAVEIFVATAEERSVSAAARRLGASPATVSQQLTNLEGAIGTALLNRNARPVALTPAGEMFLRRANAILNEADQARAELAVRDLSRLTRLRLGVIEDFDADVTPGLLSSMAEEFTRCRFLLETGPSHRLADQLEARALDMIVAADLGQALPEMSQRPLLVEPFVVAAPRGTGGEGLERRLRQLPFVQYSTRHVMGRTIAAHLARQNIVPSQRFELDSYHAIMAMVAGGAGWTILTPLGWLRAQRFREQVEIHPLPFGTLTRQIVLTARRGALEDMAERMVHQLRGLLDQMIVTPSVRALPWLEGALRTSTDAAQVP